MVGGPCPGEKICDIMRACSSYIANSCICCCWVMFMNAPAGEFCGIPAGPPGIFIPPMALPFIIRGFRGVLLFPLGPRGGSRLWLLMRSVPCCGRTRCSTESFDRSIALLICPIIRPLFGCLGLRIDFGPVGLYIVLVYRG
jgi:hypothetical protein